MCFGGLTLPEDKPNAPVAFWIRKLQPALHWILTSHDSSRQIAAGVALGVFVAFTPTIGVQTVSALALATLLKVSRIPAAVMVYITNPITLVPIYWSSYVVGAFVCGFFGMNVLGVGEFVQAFSGIREFGGFRAAGEFMRIMGVYGVRMSIPLWVGCVLLGLAAAAVVYPITLRIVEGHRVIHAQRVARKLQRKSHEAEDDEEIEVEVAAVAARTPERAEGPGYEPTSAEGGRAGADPLDTAPKADAPGGDRRAG